MRKSLNTLCLSVSLPILLAALFLSAQGADAQTTVLGRYPSQPTIKYTYSLVMSASANPVPSNKYVISPYDGVQNASFVNAGVKSEGGASRITSVSTSIATSGTFPTTLYLYAGSTLLSSKSVPPARGSLRSTVIFNNLNYTVSSSSAETLTVKGDFPSNGKQGSGVYVIINSITYQQAPNGRTITTTTLPIVGSRSISLKQLHSLFLYLSLLPRHQTSLVRQLQ